MTTHSQFKSSSSQGTGSSSPFSNEDYYDIESILLTDEKVPVEFLKAAKGLGFLDAGTAESDSDLKEGAKLMLPFWVARDLFRYKIVEIPLNNMYDDSVRATLQADPTVVSMHRYPYFYELGLLLSVLQNDGELLSLLIRTLKARYVRILDNAQNWRERDDSQFTYALTRFEKKLFEMGQKAAIDFERWKQRKVQKLLPASSIVVRKRKRDEENQ
jgi:GINS complex subunit 3